MSSATVTPAGSQPRRWHGVRAAADRLAPDLVRLRRELHRDPEVGLQLPRTRDRVRAALADLDLELHTGHALTSVVGVLRGAKPGPVVLLRGDMDALPMVEETDLAYRSDNGAMHACGHDLHTAGLVGAARLLAARREDLHGTVVLMFQPGEEGHGGGRIMVEEGVLDVAGERPEAAYAVHVGTGPRGLFMSRPGPVLAGAGSLTVTLTGRGGHGSNPARALDPVPALAEVTLALQSLVTRRLDIWDPAVLSVTRLAAGEALNVIPGSAELGATVRAFSPETVALLEREIPRLVHGVAAAHGLEATVAFEQDYPVTIADAELTARLEQLLRSEFGDDRYTTLPTPNAGSEDFSFVLQQVPGCYLMLGAGPDDVPPGTAYPHAPHVRFDDAVLADQAAALALAAWQHVGTPG